MSKLSKIGMILKIGFLGLVLVGIAKIALVLIYGYYNINLTYSGPFFYSWRVEHVDSAISKSTYIGSAKNTFPEESKDFIATYLELLQEKGIPKENIHPFYSFNVPDTFIFERDTWRIFKNLPKEQMELEYSFLRMRAELIQKILGITEVSVDEKTGKIKPVKNKNKYFPFGKLSQNEVDEFFLKRNDRYSKIYEKVGGIMAKIVKEEPGYQLEVTKDAVVMSSSFEADVMALVADIFEGTGLSFTSKDVNEFWTRLGSVYPRPFDLHILNRAYFFILYSCLGIEFEGDMLREDMKVLKEAVDELENELSDKRDEKGVVSEKYEDKERKLINKQVKLNQKKMEQFFQSLSYYLGWLYGGESPVLSKEKMFNFFLGFGYPGVIGESKEGKYRNESVEEAIAKRYSGASTA